MLQTIRLLASTGDGRVDACLAAFIGIVEAAFPERMRAYYLGGSFAEAIPVEGSDLDVVVVSKEPVSLDEYERFMQIAQHSSQLAGLYFHTGIRNEGELFARGDIPAVAATRMLLYGDDIYRRVPVMPREQWVQGPVSAAFFCLGELYEKQLLSVPLTPPEPQGEFYGFERDGMPTVAGRQGGGTKKLVNAISMAAGALVTIETGQRVAGRGKVVARYKADVHDEWTLFVEAVCALRSPVSGYALPEEQEERRRLRALCARVPAFGNAFLLRCRDFLIQQLVSADHQQRLWAIQTLARVHYPGTEVPDAIAPLVRTEDREVQEAASHTLQLYATQAPQRA